MVELVITDFVLSVTFELEINCTDMKRNAPKLKIRMNRALLSILYRLIGTLNIFFTGIDE